MARQQGATEMNGFVNTRTPMQILSDVGAVLTAAARLPRLISEMAANPNVREDIIRTRLAVHNVPADAIENVVALYNAQKART
jgi:hypothetical protein